MAKDERGDDSLWAGESGESAGERASKSEVNPSTDAEPSVPTKVCPKCSAQERTAGEFCPHCGTSYVRRPRRFSSKRARIILVTVLGLLLLGGAAAGVVLKVQHDNDVKAQREQQRAADKRAQEQKAAQEQRAKEKAAADDVQRSLRKSMVKDLQGAITKDARKNVANGLLDGPISRTECSPVGGGSEDDLTAHTGKYECTAINKTNGDGSYEGYRFSGTINYDDFSYSWHLGS